MNILNPVNFADGSSLKLRELNDFIPSGVDFREKVGLMIALPPGLYQNLLHSSYNVVKTNPKRLLERKLLV